MIEFLFIDLDDTILDFHKAERIGLENTLPYLWLFRIYLLNAETLIKIHPIQIYVVLQYVHHVLELLNSKARQ